MYIIADNNNPKTLRFFIITSKILDELFSHNSNFFLSSSKSSWLTQPSHPRTAPPRDSTSSIRPGGSLRRVSRESKESQPTK